MQGQPCSEGWRGTFREPELLEGEENKEDQGQNLLQFKEQHRRNYQGFPSIQETVQFYILLFIMACISAKYV